MGLAPEEATPARLARFPRIAGYADPPLLPTTRPQPKTAEAPWRVVIEDLELASVEEIWIDSWRWNGKGRVTGALDLLPGREASLGPSRLEVAAGSLRHGESKVAERTLGAVCCEFPRFDSREKWASNLLHLENLHLTGRLAAGPSRLALTSLHLSAGGFSLEGDYRSNPGRSRGHFRAKKGKLSIRFAISSGGGPRHSAP